MTETMPQQMVIGLLVQRLGLSPGVRPWAIWTLPEAELEEFLERLTVFVDEYNDTYAVTQNEVVWRCWPKHRALVNELAVLFVMWLDATQGALSSAEKLATWHEKWLPGFQKRLADLVRHPRAEVHRR